jgi:sulfatase modifying factor 1
MHGGGRVSCCVGAVARVAVALTGCELVFPLSDRFTKGNGPDAAEGATLLPPSCAPGGPGMTNCGSGSTASCCASLEVPGGTYDRSYDGVSYTDNSYPAQVSAFRLDQYEATVGRFRTFVDAVVGGWRPQQGYGKHAHLNGGQGLSVTAGASDGWDPSWTSNLPATAIDWTNHLANGTWTADAAGDETLPITQVDWYASYAFCIWDGGFLPSEAEWNLAAAGGSEQRVYPWSKPASATTIACTYANYGSCTLHLANPVGSESPAGDSKWGQSDLAGNVQEWVLDGPAVNDAGTALSYTNPCADCADLTDTTHRVLRGGGFNAAAADQSTSVRPWDGPTHPKNDYGFRCARTPQ